MSSASHRTLPARADLEQQKKQAKELLAAFGRGDDEARARVRAELPDKNPITLADAQFVLAREYGFSNWAALKQHVEELELTTRSPLERMKDAVRDRDARALRRVLERYPDAREAINKPIFAFDSPAIVSVSGSDDVEVVDVLLEFGADPNRRSSWWAGRFHALHGASHAVGERLLAAGATADACGAAHLNRLDLLAQLLAADPGRANERGGDGQTPLHFARSREAADMLLAAGADIDARDVDHRSSPAEWMLGDADSPEKSRVALARYLVERGAAVDIFLAAALGLTDRALAIIARDPNALTLRTGQGHYAEKRPSSYHIYLWTIGSNLTPLQTAAKFGQRETLDAMLAVSAPEQRLLLACHEGDEATARGIIREHADIIAGLSPVDRRALTDEAWRANARAVELMMELGFDPAVQSVTGPTGGNALHCAAWEGSVDCVGAILRYPSGRALIGVRDATYGGTPLSWCCHGSRNCGNPRANHAEVARRLIAAGARVDPGMEGGTDELRAVLEEGLER